MIGLGTIANAAAIVAGGLIGLAAKRFLSARYQETMIKAMGFAVIVMALGGTLSKMLTVSGGKLGTQGEMRMILALAGGALIGEFINLDKGFDRLGKWLRDKTGSSGDVDFINAFVTASLTVCVGAMAVLGSIQDGLNGDHNTLFAKAVIDFVLIAMMTASLGKGCIFSALPVAVVQGSITVLARLIAPIMNEAALDSIGYVGNILILCVGVNLVWPKTIRVANLLPAIVLAVLFVL